MKKALSLILVAVLMSVLCVPASAAMTEQNVAINKSYTTAGIYADQSGNIPYPDEEGKTLTDGQYASGGYSDALWVGFNIGAPDIASADPKVGSVVVDLGESFDITGISGHFSAGAADAGIAPPSKVTFYASNNGTEWTLIGEGVKEEIADGDLTLNIGIDEVEATGRYFKMEIEFATNWAFVSEFEVFAMAEESETETPSTGDGAVIFAIVALLACAGAAVVVKAAKR